MTGRDYLAPDDQRVWSLPVGFLRVPLKISLLAVLIILNGCQTLQAVTGRALPPVGYSIKADESSQPPKIEAQPALPAPVAPSQEAPPQVAAVEAAPEIAKSPLPHEGVRAALLAPLSGPNAALGAALSNAAQLAVFDTADEQLELLPFDTKGTPQGAIDALAQALDQGVDLILGPVFSAEVKAIAPLARERGVPVIAFTTDISALGSGVFSLGFLPDVQVKTVIDQAQADGRVRIGVLAPDTELGHAMAEAAKAEVAKTGGQLIKLQYYEPGSTDLRPVAQSFADYAHRKVALAHDKDLLSGRKGPAAPAEMAAMPYDAVLLPDEGTRLKNLASLLTFYGLDLGPVKFLGTMRWDDPALAQEPTLEGSWFAAPPEAPLAAFVAHYVKSFGPLPKTMTPFAGGAYDAVALAALLAKKGAGGVSLANLTDAQGFAGVDGLFRLLPDGAADRGLAVRELIKGGSREAYPAPEKFTPAVSPLPH